eukprot:227634_1
MDKLIIVLLLVILILCALTIIMVIRKHNKSKKNKKLTTSNNNTSVINTKLPTPTMEKVVSNSGNDGNHTFPQSNDDDFKFEIEESSSEYPYDKGIDIKRLGTSQLFGVHSNSTAITKGGGGSISHDSAISDKSEDEQKESELVDKGADFKRCETSELFTSSSAVITPRFANNVQPVQPKDHGVDIRRLETNQKAEGKKLSKKYRKLELEMNEILKKQSMNYNRNKSSILAAKPLPPTPTEIELKENNGSFSAVANRVMNSTFTAPPRTLPPPPPP